MLVGCKRLNLARCGLFVVGLLAGSTSARAEQLPLKSYTRANGLVHERILRIAQDSRGFLWFCTVFGLSRFDGHRFTTHGGLTSLPINDLLETRKGVYWVATNGGGIYRLNLETTPAARQFDSTGNRAQSLVAHYPLGGDPASTRVNTLHEDRTGQVWAATDGGLFRLDETIGDGQFVRVPLGIPQQPEPLAQVWEFAEDPDGSLWIATKFGLVRRLPDTRMIHYWIRSRKGRDLVRSVLRDRNGRLWVGHETLGLIVFRPLPVSDPFTAEGRPWKNIRAAAAASKGKGPILPEDSGSALLFTTADGLGSNLVSTLIEDREGRIYTGTLNGVAVLEGDRFRNYTTDHGLASNSINCIKEDREGNLWIGTHTAGAMRLDRNGFVTFSTKDGLGHEMAFSIFENRARQLFVITREGYLNRLETGNITAVRPNFVNGPAADLRHALEDREGDWWFATIHGLYRFPKVGRIEELATIRPKAFYTTKDGLADNDVRQVYEDSRGDIWINSFMPAGEVLTRWERATGEFHRYSERHGLQPFHGNPLFNEDRAGGVWIAFRDGPLARYWGGRFSVITKEDGLPEASVMDLHLDSGGRLWVATNGAGLLLLEDPAADRPRLVNYTTAQGLISNFTFCVTEDDKRRLYISTASGMDRLDLTTNTISHLSESLMSLSVDARRDRQGALWFCTSTGVSRLLPQDDQIHSAATVLIGGLRIAGEPQPISELGQSEIAGLELRPDQNHLQIDFFGLSVAQGERLRYQFKIEGLDEEWSAPSDQRSVNLSLSPGRYRFLVRTISPDGTPGTDPASVAFRILPPIWQRWWFLASAALVLMIPVLMFARYRAARVKALRESENRFRALAETASDAIFAVDEQGKVVFVNPAAETVFGYTKQEVLDGDMSLLIPKYRRALRMAGLGDDASLEISWDARETRGIHKTGSELPLELSFGEFSRNSKRYFTIIARDVTERKRAEEALKKSREERLVELEQVRRRIATDLHDDIGTTLSQINLLSEVVRQKVREDTRLSEPLSMISNASHELVSSMSDIVWAINPLKDHLDDLVHRMRRFASDTLAARDIAFHFAVPDGTNDVKLGANIRREVFLIFKECINNLARHSGCTAAEIEFRIADEVLLLKVADNGKGFDASRQSDGHGLTSMRDRAGAINGDLDIRSTVGKGVVVSLKVPMTRQDHPQESGQAEESGKG